MRKASIYLVIIVGAAVLVSANLILISTDERQDLVTTPTSLLAPDQLWPSVDASMLEGDFLKNRTWEGDILNIGGGEFKFRFWSCMQDHQCSGKLAYKNNEIVLTPNDGHSSKGLAATTTCPFDKGAVILLPVRWDERLYLIEKDRLLEFCNEINLGLEPRMKHLGFYFYMRRGDHEKRARGAPELSVEWGEYVLQKPIKCKVIRQREHVITVDATTRDGLRKGMTLVSVCNSGTHPGWTNRMEVVSVGDSASLIEVRAGCWPKVGEFVSTKIPDGAK